MNENAVYALLTKFINQAGSQAKAARLLGISPPALCDILHGNRGFGMKVLKGLGIRKVVAVSYEWETMNDDKGKARTRVD